MYSRLSKLCKHQNDKVRQKAFPALDAFFLRVANELVSGVRNEQSDQQTFKVLLQTFFFSKNNFLQTIVFYEKI